jgi:hypothetical protein
MRERAARVLGGEDAWVVGGAVRNELLGLPVLDLDIACSEPAGAARRFARQWGGAPFLLSARHGAWRVLLADGRTIDFTPVRGDSVERDLAERDFTINAIAVPLAGGDPIDPFGGQADLARRVLRPVSEHVFDDDPLRLLRAVRIEDELGVRLNPEAERLVRDKAALLNRAAGERILEELLRLSAGGYERLAELGLLEPLGGAVDQRVHAFDSPWFRLAAALQANVKRLPVSTELRRFVQTMLRARQPADDSPRAIYRFRRTTEPWALEALAFVGAPQLAPAVERAREDEPAEPLLRGDELGIPPGPEVGRLLDVVAEERAAGTISTRAEAEELVRRSLE